MGLRLALMIVPLLIVLASSVLMDRVRQRNSVSVSAVLLIVWMGLSVASFQPHLLPYVNELVPDRTMIWRVLADSNLDWGQADVALKSFLKDQPGASINPLRPTTGTVVVSANILTGVLDVGDRRWYRWLSSTRRPVDHIAYAYLVFVIGDRDIAEFAAWPG
jgi:hypothetical protein